MKSDAIAHIPFLDGVRALAALMVMTFHFVGRHGEPAIVRQVAVIGQTGVELFFVLSGFLITRILLAAKGAPHFFATFYARRALRIFPLYYGFLLFFFFVQPHIFTTEVSPSGTQIWAWLYLQNVPMTFSNAPVGGPGHFWSLAVEEHFYFVWPLAIAYLTRRQTWFFLAGVLVAPVLFRFLFLENGIPVFYFTLTRLDSLGYGALLALISTSDFSIVVLTRWFRAALIGLTILLIPSFAVLSGSHYEWLQVVKLSLIPALYFAFLGFCIFDPLSSRLTRMLSVAPLRWIGSISYGLYVFHILCFITVYKLAPSLSLISDFFASFLLTFLIAGLSYRYLESPILRCNRFFPYSKPVGRPEMRVPSPALN